MNYKRIIIAEPGLRDFHGHYFNVTFLLAEECRRRGLKYVILANNQIDGAVSAALPSRPIPHFVMGSYFGTSVDPLAGPIENYIDLNRAFACDLFRLTPHISSDDLLIVPTASERLMAAFAGWLAQLDAHRRPRCVLSFSFAPQGVDNPLDIHVLRMLYRTGFNAIRRSRGRDRMTFVTNSAIDEYCQLAGFDIGEVPVAQPARFVVDEFSQTRRADSRVSVAYLGAAATRKGFHLLPGIIERALAAIPDLRFVVQVYGYGPGGRPDGELEATAVELERLAAANSGAIDLRHGPLSLFDFYSVLGATDVVLTAYSTEYDQISGVFHEAVAFGKVLIARKGSSIHGEGLGLQAGMVSFEDHTAQSVANAVVTAARDVDSLLGQARATAERWHRDRGTGPYLDRILAQCAHDDENPTGAAERNGDHVDNLITALANGDLAGLMVSLRQSLHRIQAWRTQGGGSEPIAWEALDVAADAIGAFHGRTRALQDEVSQLRRSTSWRITRPVRALARLRLRPR